MKLSRKQLKKRSFKIGYAIGKGAGFRDGVATGLWRGIVGTLLFSMALLALVYTLW